LEQQQQQADPLGLEQDGDVVECATPEICERNVRPVVFDGRN